MRLQMKKLLAAIFFLFATPAFAQFSGFTAVPTHTTGLGTCIAPTNATPGVQLCWTGPGGTININRWTDAAPTPVAIATTTGSTYTDTTAVPNTIYFYSVSQGGSSSVAQVAVVSDITLPFNCPPMVPVPSSMLGVDRTVSFQGANGQQITYTIHAPNPAVAGAHVINLTPCGGSVAFTNSSAVIGFANTFAINDAVQFRSPAGILPTNFSEGVDYFVIAANGTQFQVSATMGGSAVVAGSAGTGVSIVFKSGCSDYTNINTSLTTLQSTGGTLNLGAGEFHEFNPSWASGGRNLTFLGDDIIISGATVPNGAEPITHVFFNQMPPVAISSGTYVSGTGVITLAMAAPVNFGPGNSVTIAGLTGTGAYTSLAGTWTATTGTTGSTAVLIGPIGAGAATITGGGSRVGGNTVGALFGGNRILFNKFSIDWDFPNALPGVITNDGANQRFTVTNGPYYVPDPTNPPILQSGVMDAYNLTNGTYDLRAGGRAANGVPVFNPNFAMDGLYYYTIPGLTNLPSGTSAIMLVKTAGTLQAGANTQDVSYEDIRVYGGGGPGILQSGGAQGFRLTNVQVEKKPLALLAPNELPRFISLFGDNDANTSLGNVLIEHSQFGFIEDDTWYQRGTTFQLQTLSSTSGFMVATAAGIINHAPTTNDFFRFTDPGTYRQIGTTTPLASWTCSLSPCAQPGNVWTFSFAAVPELAPYVSPQVTVTIATPGVFTWPQTNAIPVAGSPVVVTTTGALPTGLVAGTTYFVANDANYNSVAGTFAVSDTQAHALAGTNQVATSGTQSGTHISSIPTTMPVIGEAAWGAPNAYISNVCSHDSHGKIGLLNNNGVVEYSVFGNAYFTPLLGTNGTAVPGGPTLADGPGGTNMIFRYNKVINAVYGQTDLQTIWTGVAATGTATFMNGSADITFTNTFAVAQPVQFTTTGTLPANFDTAANSAIYYVIVTGLTGSKFQVSNKVGGTPIVAGSAGSGVQTVQTVKSNGYPQTGYMASGISVGALAGTGFAPPGYTNAYYQIIGNFISNVPGLGILMQSANNAAVTGNTVVDANQVPYAAGFNATFCGINAQGWQAFGANQPWCLNKIAAQGAIMLTNTRNLDHTSTPNVCLGTSVSPCEFVDTSTVSKDNIVGGRFIH